MTLLHEWPLVFFTLTVQLAVGLHLALLAAEELFGMGGRGPGDAGPGPHGLGPWASREGPPSPMDSPEGRNESHGEEPERRPRLGDRGPSFLVGVLMGAALIISLLHLGTPLNALHTLSNLDDSWLSREILAALIFMGLWGSGFWLGRRPGAAPWKVRALAWATALTGMVLIWTMARIYMVPARPLWNHWLTAAGFLLTALLLGASAVAAWLEQRSASESPSPGPISFPGTAGAALLLAGLAAALAQVAATLAHPLTMELMASAPGRPLALLRLLLLLGGAFILVIPLLRRLPMGLRSSRVGSPGRWAVAALLLLGASEVVGRMLFYAVGTVEPF